jgi:GNAT superfamily N-acetyltransferase
VMTSAIRRASPTDARAAAELHLRTVLFAYEGIFPPHAPPPELDVLRTDWDRQLSQPGVSGFVAPRRQRIIGTVIARLDAEDPTLGEVARLHVDPDFWGRGIGTVLLGRAISELGRQRCSRVGLWVLERNDRARVFYEHHGWVREPGQRTPWPGLDVVEVRYALRRDHRSAYQLDR